MYAYEIRVFLILVGDVELKGSDLCTYGLTHQFFYSNPSCLSSFMFQHTCSETVAGNKTEEYKLLCADMQLLH